jgi:hypothetical protein
LTVEDGHDLIIFPRAIGPPGKETLLMELWVAIQETGMTRASGFANIPTADTSSHPGCIVVEF